MAIYPSNMWSGFVVALDCENSVRIMVLQWTGLSQWFHSRTKDWSTKMVIQEAKMGNSPKRIWISGFGKTHLLDWTRIRIWRTHRCWPSRVLTAIDHPILGIPPFWPVPKWHCSFWSQVLMLHTITYFITDKHYCLNPARLKLMHFLPSCQGAVQSISEANIDPLLQGYIAAAQIITTIYLSSCILEVHCRDPHQGPKLRLGGRICWCVK